MRYFDCHIHLGMNGKYTPEQGFEQMNEANVTGGNVFSPPPARFQFLNDSEPKDCEQRVARVLEYTAVATDLYPFYWIDPTEPDALEQARYATNQGMVGFKIICSGHYPGDERAMPVYHAIAQMRKPIQFHSGILYDSMDSSKYNKPTEFECMLEVPGLRFSIAHFSWPWVDECIALFGKFQRASQCRHTGKPVEIWLDNTPGTPKMYRAYAFQHVLGFSKTAYKRVMFGVDNVMDDYGADYARTMIERDTTILNEIGASEEQKQDIFANNMVRFVKD